MSMRNGREAEAMRGLLVKARTANSRMVAAALGAHLSAIEQAPAYRGADESLGKASDAVRAASLQLLKALHRGKGVKSARSHALRSVDRLAGELLRHPPSRPAEKPATPDLTPRAAFRLGFLGRFGMKRPSRSLDSGSLATG